MPFLLARFKLSKEEENEEERNNYPLAIRVESLSFFFTFLLLWLSVVSV
jgi:hypothetical protein